MLHIISKSPSQCSATLTLLQQRETENAILLLGDGLYWSAKPNLLCLGDAHIFAIETHRQTRGLKTQAHIQYITIDEMVAITEQFSPSCTW